MTRLRQVYRQGFSLVEMIIVVAVLAILISISSPALFEFMRQRDVQDEENLQLQLNQALRAYVADRNAVPSEASWSSDLAGYTNLSTQQIATDVWGNPRAYVAYIDKTRQLQGASVSVTYVTVLSMGPNARAENASGVAIVNNVFGPATNTSWWDTGRRDSDDNNAPNQTIISAFANLSPAGDDLVMRYTDYPEKIEAYNTTVQRMGRVVQALESYSQNGYANRIAYCNSLYRNPSGTVFTTATFDAGTEEGRCNNSMPEKTIYYPRALPLASAPQEAAGTLGLLYDSSTLVVDNNGSSATRRDDMIRLMRVLGLPDDFCCSALTTFADANGRPQPEPFFYFSNPRARTSAGTCAASRPGPADLKLPARLSTRGADTGSPPACG